MKAKLFKNAHLTIVLLGMVLTLCPINISAQMRPLKADWTKTGWYGERRAYAVHKGLDMAAPKGTKVYATVSGVVIETKDGVGNRRYRNIPGDDNRSYGNTILIRGDHGVDVFYAHLLGGSLRVRKGDRVRVGQLIASVGRSGTASGYHLHFEVRVGGRKVNPEKFFSENRLPKLNKMYEDLDPYFKARDPYHIKNSMVDQWYYPISPYEAEGLVQEGYATAYGQETRRLRGGSTTAYGEPFIYNDPTIMTVAHRTLPHNTMALIYCYETGQQVVVRINDRGPFPKDWKTANKIVDLTPAVIQRLGFDPDPVAFGVQKIRLTVLHVPGGRFKPAVPIDLGPAIEEELVLSLADSASVVNPIFEYVQELELKPLSKKETKKLLYGDMDFTEAKLKPVKK